MADNIKPKHHGDEVYRMLMDLDLTLQDAELMGPLRQFLGTMEADSPALSKLRGEVEAFVARIDSLVAGAMASMGPAQTT